MSGTDRETVKVVVRCRPFSEKERSGGFSNVVSMDSSSATLSICDPQGSLSDPPKTFTFDSVFGQEASQTQVYNTTARPIVESVLKGYNGTVFAYGQTGTGKTFSMEGVRDVPELRGIIPNAIHHIFTHIQTAGRDSQFLVRASYLEIYNEDVIDLLNPKAGKLEVKERPDTGVYVKDLRTFVVKDAVEMEKLMTFGNKNRSVGSTAMNERSSRSHSIFSITIEASSQNEAGEDHIRVGKLHLVDLAGSERQTKTQASGDRLKEAAKINLSLSALGNVISALVDGKSSHIPYRDSKLTRLLQDSLGGNSNTLMVATVSPASYNFDESLSTLRYANRAKNIKNKPKINEDPKDAMLREFQEEILRLKAQLESGDGEVIVREVEEIHEVEEIEEVEGDEDIGVEDDETEQNLECVEEGGAKKSRKEITKASSTKATPKRRKSTKGSSSDTIDQSRLQAVKDQIEAEKAAILVKKDLEESEKNRLIQEAEKRVKDIEIERRKKEDVAKRLAQMEQKLLAGGVNLLDKNEQQKLVLAKKAQELEEKARKERDLQRQLAEKEELNLQIEEEFSTLQEAAVSKTKKLKKLWNILVTHKTEIQDLQQECQRDREALLDTIRALSKHLKHQLLILDAFIAPEEQVLIEQFAEFDDAAEKWRIPFVAHAGNNIRGKRALVSGNVIKASGRREKKNGKAQEEEDGIGQWDPMCAFSNVYLRYDLGKSKRKTSLRMSGNASVTPKSGPPRKGSPTKDSNRRSSLKGTPSDSPIPVPEPIPTARGLVGRNRHYA